MTGEQAATARARLLIAAAAVFWSLSGLFTKILTKPTIFDLHEPAIAPLQLAFFRCFFAGLVLLPMLRPGDVSFRPAMLGMMVCFAVMNATFVSAMALGTAASAIFLQYSAPIWMFIASVLWLGEKADRRNLTSLIIGLTGVAIILIGGWREAQLDVVAIALTSGVTYAAVVVFLRLLRGASVSWLTVLNQLAGSVVLIPAIVGYAWPTPGQMVVLFLYGSVQLALPYWLMAHSMRRVSPQEAGTITLLEPVLNPVWAFLIAGEKPDFLTLIGGSFIVGALAWRYAPFSRQPKPAGPLEPGRPDENEQGAPP